MRYCANCGVPYERSWGVCPSCYLDQTVPQEFMDRALSTRRSQGFVSGDLPIGYPGERGALRLAILVSLVLGGVLGALSLGLFLIIVALSLIYLRMAYVSAKHNMIKASEQSFQRLFRLAKVAAYRLKLSLPEVYVTQDPAYNASTMGFGRHGFIVVNSGLVEAFSPQELLFILGHEMGHMKKFHTTWLALLQPGRAAGARFTFAPFMEVIFNVWRVKGEYTADQAGLFACDSVHAASAALLKVAGGAQVEREVDIRKLLDGGREDKRVLEDLFEYVGTHPFTQNRVRHLWLFAASPQYRSSRWWAEDRGNDQ